MKHSIKTGFSFGLTSSIITTLGLMVGLYSGTRSKIAVIGGIITIAIADALSDALGIHVSEESEGKHNNKEIWESTLSTFSSKFFFALSFLIPLLLFNSILAIIINIIWGIILLSGVSFYISKESKIQPWKVIVEHLSIAILVIVIAHYLGVWIHTVFN